MKKNIVKILLVLIIMLLPTMNVQAVEVAAYKFQGSNPSLSNDDLEFLKAKLQDKEIIAVGEATHGTKEFFEMKHRMLKFLVEELDYKAFAMEQGMASMYQINNYIQGESVDIKDLIKTLHPVWQTQEVIDMINWAKDYNSKVTEDKKIRFYGCDIQMEMPQDNNLINYYDRVTSEAFKAIYERYINSTSDEKKDDEIFYKNVSHDLEKNKEKYINKLLTYNNEEINYSFINELREEYALYLSILDTSEEEKEQIRKKKKK